jgi:hypothetical protein
LNLLARLHLNQKLHRKLDVSDVVQATLRAACASPDQFQSESETINPKEHAVSEIHPITRQPAPVSKDAETRSPLLKIRFVLLFVASHLFCIGTGFLVAWALTAPPPISNQYTAENPSVTKENFAKIKPGMTYNEIEEMFGDSGIHLQIRPGFGSELVWQTRVDPTFDLDHSGHIGRKWLRRNDSFVGDPSITVEFEGGKVKNKEAYRLE